MIFKNKIDERYFTEIMNSNKFKKWKTKIEKNFKINDIIIHKVHMFGKKVGFIHAEIIGTDLDGHFIPGIAFIRGNSVSILVVVKNTDTNEKYVILTNQARVPAGKNILESPAGMIDEGNITSKAIEELKEEVGNDLDFSEAKLIPLESGFTSPGGSDEFIDIYAYELSLNSKQIEEIKGRITGEVKENEYIELDIVPFNEVLKKSESIITKLGIYSYLSKIN